MATPTGCGLLLHRWIDGGLDRPPEGIAVTADECVTSLPVFPSGKYKRTMNGLYALVAATAGRASEVRERSEDMHAQIQKVATGKKAVTPALALRVARFAGVPMDE